MEQKLIEMLENTVSNRKRNLVAGVGINDAPFNTSVRQGGKMVHHPAYKDWSNMINRCYRGDSKSYKGCSVCEEWLYFSNFLTWWRSNHREGYQLDKDILVLGNRVYGPDTCIYVPGWLNRKEARSRNNDKLPGVTFDHNLGKYKAQRDGGDNRYIGYFETAEEAHDVWVADGGQERRDIWLQQLVQIRNQKSI